MIAEQLRRFSSFGTNSASRSRRTTRRQVTLSDGGVGDRNVSRRAVRDERRAPCRRPYGQALTGRRTVAPPSCTGGLPLGIKTGPVVSCESSPHVASPLALVITKLCALSTWLGDSHVMPIAKASSKVAGITKI